MHKSLIIHNILNIKNNKWNDYVNCHPNSTVFQTTDYLHLHTKRFNSNFFGYAAIKDGEICGVISGVIFYNYFFPFNCFTRRAIVIGGPLIDGNDLVICEALLKHLLTELKNKAIYIQFRNLWDIECYRSIFEEIGFTYEPHLDILHDLSLDNERIKSKVSKNKRGNINKSINKGLFFYEVTDREEYKQCVDLVIQTYKRIGLPCFEKKYFLTANELLGKEGLLKTFAAKIDNHIIGTRMELCYKDMVYDWYAGADENFKSYYPNDFIPYHILLWGKENKFKTFDFGGAGKPDVPYGVRDHKLKFGGELVEYGRFLCVLHPLLYKISKLGVYIFKKLK